MVLKVHHLRPAPGAKKARTRKGRGEASKGKTAGRGGKGTRARNVVRAGFEGGQLPLVMRLPKLRGFKNPERVEYQPVNVSTINSLFPKGGNVSVEDLDHWTPTDLSRHHRVEIKEPAKYLPAVRSALKRLEPVDFLIYYAGMDPHENAGGIQGITTPLLQKRDRSVAAWCRKKRVPVIFAPAGGYTEQMSLEELATLHLDTVRAFAEAL